MPGGGATKGDGASLQRKSSSPKLKRKGSTRKGLRKGSKRGHAKGGAGGLPSPLSTKTDESTQQERDDIDSPTTEIIDKAFAETDEEPSKQSVVKAARIKKMRMMTSVRSVWPSVAAVVTLTRAGTPVRITKNVTDPIGGPGATKLVMVPLRETFRPVAETLKGFRADMTARFNCQLGDLRIIPSAAKQGGRVIFGQSRWEEVVRSFYQRSADRERELVMSRVDGLTKSVTASLKTVINKGVLPATPKAPKPSMSKNTSGSNLDRFHRGIGASLREMPTKDMSTVIARTQAATKAVADGMHALWEFSCRDELHSELVDAIPSVCAALKEPGVRVAHEVGAGMLARVATSSRCMVEAIECDAFGALTAALDAPGRKPKSGRTLLLYAALFIARATSDEDSFEILKDHVPGIVVLAVKILKEDLRKAIREHSLSGTPKAASTQGSETPKQVDTAASDSTVLPDTPSGPHTVATPTTAALTTLVQCANRAPEEVAKTISRADDGLRVFDELVSSRSVTVEWMRLCSALFSCMAGTYQGSKLMSLSFRMLQQMWNWTMDELAEASAELKGGAGSSELTARAKAKAIGRHLSGRKLTKMLSGSGAPRHHAHAAAASRQVQLQEVVRQLSGALAGCMSGLHRVELQQKPQPGAALLGNSKLKIASLGSAAKTATIVNRAVSKASRAALKARVTVVKEMLSSPDHLVSCCGIGAVASVCSDVWDGHTSRDRVPPQAVARLGSVVAQLEVVPVLMKLLLVPRLEARIHNCGVAAVCSLAALNNTDVKKALWSAGADQFLMSVARPCLAKVSHTGLGAKGTRGQTDATQGANAGKHRRGSAHASVDQLAQAHRHVLGLLSTAATGLMWMVHWNPDSDTAEEEAASRPSTPGSDDFGTFGYAEKDNLAGNVRFPPRRARGLVDLFVAMLEVQSLVLIRIAMLSIWSIAANHQNRSDIRSAGGLEQCVKWAALLFIARTRALRLDDRIHEGLPDTMLNWIINESGDDPGSHKPAFGKLVRVAGDGTGVKVTGKRPKSIMALEASLAALWLLLFDRRNQRRFVELGGCAVLVDVLYARTADTEINACRRIAMGALWNLAANESHRAIVTSAESGVPEVVLAVSKSPKFNADLRVFAAGFMMELLRDEEVKDRLQLSAGKDFHERVLVGFLQSTDPTSQEYGARTVARTCRSARSKRAIAALGGCELLVKMIVDADEVWPAEPDPDGTDRSGSEAAAKAKDLAAAAAVPEPELTRTNTVLASKMTFRGRMGGHRAIDQHKVEVEPHHMPALPSVASDDDNEGEGGDQAQLSKATDRRLAALHALLNLTTEPVCQEVTGKIGAKLLFTLASNGDHPDVQAFASRCILNVRKNPKTQTVMYRQELKMRAKRWRGQVETEREKALQRSPHSHGKDLVLNSSRKRTTRPGSARSKFTEWLSNIEGDTRAQKDKVRAQDAKLTTAARRRQRQADLLSPMKTGTKTVPATFQHSMCRNISNLWADEDEVYSSSSSDEEVSRKVPEQASDAKEEPPPPGFSLEVAMTRAVAAAKLKKAITQSPTRASHKHHAHSPKPKVLDPVKKKVEYEKRQHAAARKHAEKARKRGAALAMFLIKQDANNLAGVTMTNVPQELRRAATPELEKSKRDDTSLRSSQSGPQPLDAATDTETGSTAVRRGSTAATAGAAPRSSTKDRPRGPPTTKAGSPGQSAFDSVGDKVAKRITFDVTEAGAAGESVEAAGGAHPRTGSIASTTSKHSTESKTSTTGKRVLHRVATSDPPSLSAATMNTKSFEKVRGAPPAKTAEVLEDDLAELATSAGVEVSVTLAESQPFHWEPEISTYVDGGKPVERLGAKTPPMTVVLEPRTHRNRFTFTRPTDDDSELIRLAEDSARAAEASRLLIMQQRQQHSSAFRPDEYVPQGRRVGPKSTVEARAEFAALRAASRHERAEREETRREANERARRDAEEALSTKPPKGEGEVALSPGPTSVGLLSGKVAKGVPDGAAGKSDQAHPVAHDRLLKKGGVTHGKLCRFDHVDGAHVCSSLYKHFTLPTGQTVHYYHNDTMHELIADTQVAAPAAPVTLAQIFQGMPGPPRLLHPTKQDLPPPVLPRLPDAPWPSKHLLPVALHEGAVNRAYMGVLPDLETLHFEVEELPPDKLVDEVVEEEPKHAWSLYDSVWVPRLTESDARDFYDSDRVQKRAFKVDWKRVIAQERFVRLVEKQNRGDDDAAMEAIRTTLFTYYPLISDMFDYYACLGSGDPFSIQFNAFNTMLDDMDIIDNDSRHCRQKDYWVIFTAANVEDAAHKKSVEGKANEDRALVRFELVEVFVRIAINRYVLSGQTGDCGEAVKRLFELDFQRHLSPLASHDANEYRRHHLYNEELNAVLERNLPILRILHEKYLIAQPGARKPVMGIEQWKAFLQDTGCLNEDFTMREGKMVFCWSKMNVADELRDEVRNQSLTFTDFLEALCRVADASSMPTGEDMEAAGASNAYEYFRHLEQEGRLIPRRASSDFTVPPSRPLAEKLERLLEIIFAELDPMEEGGLTVAKAKRLIPLRDRRR